MERGMGRPAKAQARVDARGELIAAAWQLFSSAGYDATPVNAIIARVGLSKGAFYYYFEGKEDILDAVVGRIIEEMALKVNDVPSMSTPTSLEKLRLFLETIGNWKLANIDIIKEAVEVIYRDENAIIRNKMNRRAVESLSPVLAEIISQGREEGVFDVDDPEETARMIIHFSNAMAEMQAPSLMRLEEDPAVLEPMLARARRYLTAIERILGASPGSVLLDDMMEGFEQGLEDGGVR
jgi:AcrR family transcriptional regulator